MTTLQNADLLTAIVTPFDDEGHVDYATLEKLTNYLISKGSNGFVIGGTTGEAATMTTEEKIELYTRFGQIVAGRCPVIAGTGSNNTAQTVEFTQQVSQIEGIDYCLVVVPYYNKPNQRGMRAHFEAVAEASRVPLMIYNIPGRTGVTMSNDTLVELSANENIAAVKQCTSLEDLEYLVDHVTDGFKIYTGEDAQALPARVLGVSGVISVASHVYVKQMRQMYDSLYEGDYQMAGKLQRWLTPKMSALFMFPSPSPVKAVLEGQGFNMGDCRLPILTLNDEEKIQLAHRLDLDNLDDLLLDLGGKLDD